MYAIIKTGGKQYRVQKDDIIEVELLAESEGTEIEFKDVLFVHDGSKAKVGTPTLSDFSVKGKLLGVVRGPKIDTIKYKRRKSQYTRFGHRQNYSRIKITKVGKANA